MQNFLLYWSFYLGYLDVLFYFTFTKNCPLIYIILFGNISNSTAKLISETMSQLRNYPLITKGKYRNLHDQIVQNISEISSLM